ncbi:hypothetical protein V6N13_061882 [Hibiscus sabdariffa]
MASARRNFNSISKIRVGVKEFCSPRSIKSAVADHFHSTYNDHGTFQADRLDCNLKTLSAKAVEMLDKPFTESEIFSALSSLDSSRAPGPDGFNMGF